MTIEINPVLLRAMTEGNATLFLGAGASLEADFPTSDELAQYLIDKSQNPDLSAMSLT